jgi:hypothetical protein
MYYKIIIATDRKLLGQKFYYEELEREELIEQLTLLFEAESYTVEGPYIRIRNSNYTIILKEI